MRIIRAVRGRRSDRALARTDIAFPRAHIPALPCTPARQVQKPTKRSLRILEAGACANGAQDGLAADTVVLQHVCLQCGERLLEGIDRLADRGIHFAVVGAVFRCQRREGEEVKEGRLTGLVL
jgi:hypothetical protein